MKSFSHIVALMLAIIMFALAITLPAAKRAQAAPPRQAAEEPIKATLEDANQSLGGGFILDSSDSAVTNKTSMKRARQGAYTNGDPVAVTDYLSIEYTTPNTYCESFPKEAWQPSTFHGMDGCSLTYGGHPANVIWESQEGSEVQGSSIVFDVGSIVDECYCFAQHPDEGQSVSYDSINALPLAEALNRAAIKNGLYEPMPGQIMPANPPQAVPGQPGAPTDAGGLFGIPPLVILGSLGIPVAGAMAGALLSTLLSGVSSTAEAAGEAAAIDEAAAQALIANQKTVFLGKFEQIIKQKQADKYYIINPDFVTNPESSELFGIVKDRFRSAKAGRCGEAMAWGKDWLGQIAKDTFGEDTYVGDITVQRSFEGADINHAATRLILPNGERLVPDVHESLSSPQGTAVLYTEEDWVDKYTKIVGGKMIVTRSGAEQELLSQIKQLGPQQGIDKFQEDRRLLALVHKYGREPGQERFKRGESLEHDPFDDFIVKSHLEHPASDPVPPPPPPDTPAPDLKDLDGKRKSGIGGHRF